MKLHPLIRHTKLCLCIISIVFSAGVVAQQNKPEQVDSLKTLLQVANDDTNKTRLYHQIANEYWKVNVEEGYRYATIGLKHADRLGWKKGSAAFLLMAGEMQKDKGNYDSAHFYCNKALLMYASMDSKINVGYCYLALGNIESSRGNFTASLHYFFSSLDIFNALGDYGNIAKLNFCIANVYFTQANYKKALAYAEKGLTVARQAGDGLQTAAGKLIVANVANAERDTVKAISLYDDLITYYGQEEDYLHLQAALGNRALLETDMAKKLAYLLKAQQIQDSIAPNTPSGIVGVGNLGTSYFELVRYEMRKKVPNFAVPGNEKEWLAKADMYYREAIKRSTLTGDKENESYYSRAISELLEYKNEYREALLFLRKGTNMHDTLYSQDIKNKLASADGDREIALRDKEIAVNQLLLRTQSQQRIALIAGVLLLLTIGVLLYRQSRNRKQTNTTLLQLNTALDDANKVKARFFAILSHDLRSPVANLISFLNLQKNAPEMLSPQEVNAHQRRLHQAAADLLETMEEMLIWSKGQMHAFQPQLKPVAVADLFAHLKKFFPVMENITMTFSNSQNAVVNTDENYLQTIMHNLTANALKAVRNLPEGRIHWQADQKQDTTVLTITDNGGGLDPAKWADAGHHSQEANSRHGFGLYIIRDLAAAIGLKIALEANRGQGTRFVLSV